jgi:SAM-dependent methyltransferase
MRWFDWRRRRPPAHTDPDSETIRAGETPYLAIGGRRRKAGIPYIGPCDSEEHRRLDFQHFLLRRALHGNYAAPLQAPSSILDVGSGTGRWAMEMANLFPKAQVLGLDINPPPIDLVAERGADRCPANYRFVAGNILDGLPFDDRHFAYVHMRDLVTAIPHDCWPFVISELARVTRPGGWIESLEATFLQGGGPAIDQIMLWLDATLARCGVAFLDGGTLGDVMLATPGVARVSSRQFALRCGEAGGHIGKMLALDWISVFYGFGGMTVAHRITTADEFAWVLEQARTELADPACTCVMPLYITYGQRVEEQS